MTTKNSTLTAIRNFGILTDISKELNQIFGDQSGRTVSMRTTHGFKNAFNLHAMHDNDAEDLVHGLMVLTPILLKHESDTANAIGVILLSGLVGCYLNGK